MNEGMHGVTSVLWKWTFTRSINLAIIENTISRVLRCFPSSFKRTATFGDKSFHPSSVSTFEKSYFSLGLRLMLSIAGEKMLFPLSTLFLHWGNAFLRFRILCPLLSQILITYMKPQGSSASPIFKHTQTGNWFRSEQNVSGRSYTTHSESIVLLNKLSRGQR